MAEGKERKERGMGGKRKGGEERREWQRPKISKRSKEATGKGLMLEQNLKRDRRVWGGDKRVEATMGKALYITAAVSLKHAVKKPRPAVAEGGQAASSNRQTVCYFICL